MGLSESSCISFSYKNLNLVLSHLPHGGCGDRAGSFLLFCVWPPRVSMLTRISASFVLFLSTLYFGGGGVVPGVSN